LGRHIVDGAFDFDKLGRTVKTAMKYLDRVIDINFYPIDTAEKSNHKWRPVGLGVMGLQDAFFQLGLAFDSDTAKKLSARIQEEIYFHAISASADLAEQFGAHANFADTKAAQGLLQHDLWGVTPTEPAKWAKLKEKIAKTGLRNSLVIAIAPTATIASIVGCYEATEPQISNLFKRETLSGEFLQINKYLVVELKKRGLWTEDVRNEIKLNDGSILNIASLPMDLKEIYRTVWEVPMKSLIDMGADRGAFIDQSQSLNLFSEVPTIGKLSSMYMYAWKRGLKTTYYLRSRPATAIAKTTVKRTAEGTAAPNAAANNTQTTAQQSEASAKKVYTDEEALVCSIENPEACEACQ
jgi:ribonucleoside-diphosphate reductase alpha chain